MSSYSAGVAEWIQQTSYEKLPSAVIENAKLRTLDLLGVMIATRNDRTVQAAAKAVLTTDGAGTATAIASRERMSVTGAAFVNGILASLMEFDDNFLPTAIHASGLCNSVMFTECHLRKVSGKAIIEAQTLGSELMIRASMVAPVHWYWFNVGLHPTGIFSVFGGIAALARMRGLTARQVVSALGHAGSMSAGLTASFEDATSTKTLHVGLGAANAFRAVALAEQGIDGPGKVFEGKFGWYRSHIQATDERLYTQITDLPGSDWKVLEIASKQFPAAYSLLPHIEAAIQLRTHHDFVPEDVVHIDAFIAPETFQNLCEPREVKIKPANSWHGRISLQHSVAEALIVGKMDKSAYAPSKISDPRINELASKVEHHADATAEPDRCGGRLVLKLRDGRELSHEIRDFRGTKLNPLRREDYLNKFKANTADLLSESVVQQTIDDFLRLEDIDDVGITLTRLVE